MEHDQDAIEEAAPFYVGPWLAKPALNSLVREDVVRIPPKVMQVLCLLARRSGAVVSREAFMEAVWANEVVGEEALTHAISALRKIFGDSPKNPQFIQTIPKKGYRLIAEVRIASAAPDAGAQRPSPTPRAPAQPRRWTRPLVRGSIGALLLALLLLGGSRLGPDLLRKAPSTPLRAMPFTSTPGSEYDPAFSPDGSKIAFTWQSNIYVKQIGAQTALQLTDTPALDGYPAWSPDGQHIAFARATREDCGLFILPALGGPERKLASCRPNYMPTLAWHPEGQWLAFSDTDALLGKEIIRLLSVDTRQQMNATTLPKDGHYPGDIYPAFSPDGKSLAFVRKHLAANTIYVQPVSIPATGLPGHTSAVVRSTDPPPVTFGNPRAVASSPQTVVGLTWTPDGQHLIYSSFQFIHAGLWRVPAAGGDPEWLSVESTQALMPTLSPQGDRLAFVEHQVTQNIWQMSLSGEGTPKGPPTAFIASTQTDVNPAFSPDGDRIAFASTRSGNGEIWICDKDGDGLFQLTDFEQPFTFLHAWSPDGRQMAFTASQDDHLDLFVVDVEGGVPRRLTQAASNDGLPGWSPDGRWIYFSSDRNGSLQTWRLPAKGGVPELVMPHSSLSPTISSDGHFLYYSKLNAPGIWRYPLAGGEERQLVDDLSPSDWNNWGLRDEGLYYVARTDVEEPVLAFFSFAKNQRVDLFTLPHAIGEVAGISVFADASGTRILFTQVENTEADIMLVDDFR